MKNMNYFELYGLPVTMKVEPIGLRKKFYELSRLYHPDFYLDAPDEKQQEMLDRSSDVNKAYKTFQHEDDTIRYVLTMKELLHDEEKYALGADFLMEVMTINEKLMELEFDPNPELLQDVESETRTLLTKSHDDVEPIITNYSEDIHSEKELLQVKDYYYRKKYLQRILDKIFQIRNIAAS
jgi:molecular chaperone HscB